MNTTPTEFEACPRCHLTTRVSPKLLLIEITRDRHGLPPSVWRKNYRGHGFSVDDLKPELAEQGPFCKGLYCAACGIGYIPESMAKPEAPRYLVRPEGVRRVFPDGTLGPLLQSISDDPDSSR